MAFSCQAFCHLPGATSLLYSLDLYPTGHPFDGLNALIMPKRDLQVPSMRSLARVLRSKRFVARTGYAAELGLGLRTSIDYSDYSLEYNIVHEEKPWREAMDRLYIDESARKMSP